jgi:hypothetical protein
VKISTLNMASLTLDDLLWTADFAHEKSNIINVHSLLTAEVCELVMNTVFYNYFCCCIY